MGYFDYDISKRTPQHHHPFQGRAFLPLAVFALLACAFLIRQPMQVETPESPLLDESSKGVGFESAESSDWEPPLEWDPVSPVYGSFEDIAYRYTSSVKNLSGDHTANGLGPTIYDPYPDYESFSYRNQYAGKHVSCIGPRGTRLNDSSLDKVNGFVGWPNGFPSAPLGSSSTIGIDQNVCFERHGRFDAYGLNPNLKSSEAGPSATSAIDWNDVDWGTLQQECVKENQDRFDMQARPQSGDISSIDSGHTLNGTKASKKRAAVLFRSYEGIKYNQDLLRTMRSIIAELSLGSGGEYEAFLLVQIKDTSVPIFDSEEIYETIKQQRVPKEFWNITVLWSEALWPKLYPLIPESAINVHFSQWLPVQYFAQKHPHFDHYWNWEMDIRYTGHHYELLEALDNFSRKQPRKGLWERNSRFFIPDYHGYHYNFTRSVQRRYQSENPWNRDDTTIWGPHPPMNQKPQAYDVYPPTNADRPEKDNFEWGVGEDADLITLLPMFNPDPTHYVWHSVHWNYPLFLNPVGPPRRTTIITFYRLSHRLLNIMHQENSRTPGHHMSSETWPQSAALHHGLKAVAAPQSIWFEKDWPAQSANFIFNNGDTQRVINGFSSMDPRGEGSGGWESVFGLRREHNFDASTWYYRALFASKLYKRFLGHEVEGMGGAAWEKKHGAYCLPPMLLHPIKEIADPDIPTVEEEIADEADPRIEAAVEFERLEKEGQVPPAT